MPPQQLKQARQALGLTQAEIAALMGRDTRTWQYWEAGKYPIPASSQKLLEFLLKEKGIKS